jgi:hypothetical protein
MWLISRRVLLTGVLPAGLLRLNSRADANDRAEARRAIAALERRHGGRIGVAILNAAGNSLITRRAIAALERRHGGRIGVAILNAAPLSFSRRHSFWRGSTAATKILPAGLSTKGTTSFRIALLLAGTPTGAA